MGKGFKELSVWQKARDLAVEIYRISQPGPFRTDFGLRDQLRRAAVSVPSNIAEGDERDTDKVSTGMQKCTKSGNEKCTTLPRMTW